MIQKELSTNLSASELCWHFQSRPDLVFLDSAMDPEKLGRYSILAWESLVHFESKNERIKIRDEFSTLEYTGDPFEALQGLYKKYQQAIVSELPFVGGFIGYFGYDLCHHIEKLPRTAIDDIGLPDAVLRLYDQAILYDHQLNKKYLIDAELRPGAPLRVDQLVDWINELEKPRIELHAVSEKPVFETNLTKEEYIEAHEKLRAYIKSGDIYQANLTQRFTTNLTQRPIDLYYKLREINPAPFAAYMPLERGAILSSSPERFISLRSGKLQTRPIKGTRPRGETPDQDAMYREELINSEKDNSELLMIVDLERNDLSRVAKVSTVKVPELMICEAYPTVYHLVSTVEAELEENLTPIDVIRATFPGGSITGAPKIRAMEVIDELEPTMRSVYTGSIGYIGLNGDMDLNIVIRTIVCHHDQACFQAGGGIVWDSVAESEYEESLQKAKAMKRALSI